MEIPSDAHPLSGQFFVSGLLQPDATSARSAAGRAVAADFKAAHDDVKLAVALDLALEAVEQIAFEFRDLAAAQAGHVDVITLRPALVIVLLALHVRQIKFVDKAMA